MAGLALKSVTVGVLAASVSDLTGPLAMAAADVPAAPEPPEKRTEAVFDALRPQNRIQVSAPRMRAAVHRPDGGRVAKKKRAEATGKADVKRKQRRSGAHGRHRAVPAAPGHVRHWISAAIAIMRDRGIPVSQRDADSIWTIVLKESSGNPRAINLWDSNARAGHPSKGLMQTIDSTFAAYQLPGYDDIYHPVHNIIAGVRYTLSRYGGFAGHPGLRALAAGGGYVGY